MIRCVTQDVAHGHREFDAEISTKHVFATSICFPENSQSCENPEIPEDPQRLHGWIHTGSLTGVCVGQGSPHAHSTKINAECANVPIEQSANHGTTRTTLFTRSGSHVAAGKVPCEEQ